MRKSLFFLLLFLPIYLAGQTRNYPQELTDILLEGKCFNEINFYKENKDFLQDDYSQNFYFAMTYTHLNQPDSAIIYFNRLFDTYPGIFGTHAINIMENLKVNYMAMQDYQGAWDVVEKQIAIAQNAQEIDEATKTAICDDYRQQQQHYERFLSQPKMEIIYPKGENNHLIKLDTLDFIIFDAKYNNKNFRTLFDTGAQSCLFMSKRVADKIGVKKITEEKEWITNGKPTNANFCLIDSMNIGNILIKNIPAFVVDDEILPDSSTINNFDIVIGLPFLRHLGSVEVDVENREVNIFSDSQIAENLKPNMYIVNNSLVLNSEINGIDFNAFFDTGANYYGLPMGVDEHFYEKHSDKILLNDSIDIQTMPTISFGKSGYLKFKLPSELDIELNDKVYNMKGKSVVYQERGEDYNRDFDGFIYYPFLKLYKKSLFDFNKMTLYVEE